MSLLAAVAKLASALNVLLLLGLLYVWGRNYLRFRSKHTLGLSVFSVFLLLESLLTLYYYTIDPNLSAWLATDGPRILWQAMMVLDVLEFFGLAFFAWVTWD